MIYKNYRKNKDLLNNYEQVAKSNGFVLTNNIPYPIYDTKQRGQYDYFYDWRDACTYYGLIK